MATFANVFFALVIVFLALYVELPKYRDDPEVADLIASDTSVHAAFFSNALAEARSSLDASGAYTWGRTTHPHFSLDLHPLNPVQLYTEMKEFVWVSVTSGPWLVGFAIMQLQYADNLVLQVYRRGADGTTSLKTKVTIPLVSPLLKWGTEWLPNATGAVGPSAVGHRVVYHSPPWAPEARAALTFTETEVLFDVQANVKGTWEGSPCKKALLRLKGAAQRPLQLMGLSFPLGPHRPSLVNKMAAVPLISGSTTLSVTMIGGGGAVQQVELKDGLLAMDYTRGLLRRHTRWYWACLSDPASRLGFHLSSGTYDVDGVSMEASLFDARDGTTSFLDEAVQFTKVMKGGDGHVAWHITSPSIDLTFTPQEGYGGRVHLGVIDVNLDHQWGSFSGRVTRKDGTEVQLDVARGVFEEHDALW